MSLHEPLDPEALPRLQTPPPGPRSAAWLQRLRAVESPNVTAIADDFPIVWARARGPVVEDVDGNRYLDAGSAFGVALIGHGHPAVRQALAAQADALLHGMGDVHPTTVRIALLEALAAAAPGDLGHGVLCTGGSEAVEVALQTALLHTGRTGIVAFDGAYHGLSLGALAGTHRDDFRAPFRPWLPGPTTFAPFPSARPNDGAAEAEALAAALAQVEQALSHPTAPAGVVLVEPIQGRGGTRLPAPGLLPALRALCDRYGALLALDEIFTGCGRTGLLFACQHDAGHGGVVPDLLCIGKALGGGLPIAACLGRPHVMASWGPSKGEALRTSTFLGHPLAAAAACATLHVLASPDGVDRAAAEGEVLGAALRQAFDGHAAVADVRGRGLMWGVALRAVGARPAGALAWQVVVGCLRRGLLLLPCGADGAVLQWTPPIGWTPAQRRFAIAACLQALDEAVG